MQTRHSLHHGPRLRGAGLVRKQVGMEGETSQPYAAPSPNAPRCDLRWAASTIDAHARYAAALRRGPVCYDPKQRCWCIFGYDAALACLRDADRFRGDPIGAFHPVNLSDDPQRPGRFRHAMQSLLGAFNRTLVADFTTRWLDGFLADMSTKAEFDAVSELAVPLVDDLAGALIGLHPGEIARLAASRPANRTDVSSSDAGAMSCFVSILRERGSPPRSGALRSILDHVHAGDLTEQQAAELTQAMWSGVTLPTNLLLAFGFGTHFCIGAAMSRALAETAVSHLLRSSMSLRCVTDADQLRYEEGDMRGLTFLRMRLS